MKRTRSRIALYGLLAAGLWLAGCKPRESSSEAKPRKPRIALIMKSLANEFFQTMEQGAQAHHKTHADEYELIVAGIKDELDVARQINLVEQMAAQGVDAIVIAPADSKALLPVCKKAVDAGIIVVNIDNKPRLEPTSPAASGPATKQPSSKARRTPSTASRESWDSRMR